MLQEWLTYNNNIYLQHTSQHLWTAAPGFSGKEKIFRDPNGWGLEWIGKSIPGLINLLNYDILGMYSPLLVCMSSNYICWVWGFIWILGYCLGFSTITWKWSPIKCQHCPGRSINDTYHIHQHHVDRLIIELYAKLSKKTYHSLRAQR